MQILEIAKITSTDCRPKKLLQLASLIELKKTKENLPEFHLSIADLKTIFKGSELPENVDVIVQNMPVKVNRIDDKLIYKLDKKEIFTSASESICTDVRAAEKILVEFSSPNIAKPFHVGHLRSTIIGNFISNLLQYTGHNVLRLNYLGDWGTQFGYLTLGMDMANITDEQMKKNPIQHLFKAYVEANRLGETNDNVSMQARNIFLDLENGKCDNLGKWNTYRVYTVEELKKIYQRLGIHFDEYCWESDYRKTTIEPFLNDLLQKNILCTDEDGKVIMKFNNRNVPVIKSDGTTLYLARDIAALNDRNSKHRFDRMLYIVDNGQADHFNSLFEMGKRLSITGAEHVKFGRIKKMSTRKGNVVFLSDILDEARFIMRSKQAETKSKHKHIFFCVFFNAFSLKF